MLGVSITLQWVSWLLWADGNASSWQAWHVERWQIVPLILVGLACDIVAIIISIIVSVSFSDGWRVSEIHMA